MRIDSIPPLRDQPGALVCRHVIFLDGLLDRRLFVRLIVDDADQLGRGCPSSGRRPRSEFVVWSVASRGLAIREAIGGPCKRAIVQECPTAATAARR
jgi:hypothetical protein